MSDRIQEIEQAMTAPDFWADSVKAQAMIKELQSLKDEALGVGKYDRGGAVLSVLAGAGGDDAEDFAGMLFRMYQAYAASKGWQIFTLDTTPNELDGYRNATVEISGKNVYGTLKHEMGVHRLVRLSPFNVKHLLLLLRCFLLLVRTLRSLYHLMILNFLLRAVEEPEGKM